MLLCVILVWPTKFENSLSFCKTCLMLENMRVLIENLNFGKIGFKTSVFEKTFHLILMHFIHKIQCFEFLCKNAVFFKKLIFPEFRPIEPIFQSIEIAIKICYESLSVSIDARLVLDQSKHFWPIESNFRSVENHIESFLKTEFLTCSSLFKLFFKTLSLYSIGPRVQTRFLSFSTKIIQGFLSSKAGKTFIPLLFFYF